MNIEETLVLENELNTLFNQEENNEKKHITYWGFSPFCGRIL